MVHVIIFYSPRSWTVLFAALDIELGIITCFVIGFLPSFLMKLIICLLLDFTALEQTIAESVGDWFFNRKAVKQIDCPYPCNPTCYHLDFTQGWWILGPLQCFLYVILYSRSLYSRRAACTQVEFFLFMSKAWSWSLEIEIKCLKILIVVDDISWPEEGGRG